MGTAARMAHLQLRTMATAAAATTTRDGRTTVRLAHLRLWTAATAATAARIERTTVRLAHLRRHQAR